MFIQKTTEVSVVFFMQRSVKFATKGGSYAMQEMKIVATFVVQLNKLL